MYTYSFVGTHDCLEKVGVFYGGITPNFDPAAYIPGIRKVRDAGRVLDGLVGGWLPALRFVYPEKPGDWSELVIYAPMRVENGNQRVQPVWYRVCRVENNALRWVRYFDSYHPFRRGWRQELNRSTRNCSRCARGGNTPWRKACRSTSPTSASPKWSAIRWYAK